MKFTPTLLLTALHLVGVLAIPSSPTECGSLGVMTINTTTLPDGINPHDIRKCADHPAGAAIHENKLAGRDCYYGAPYGCSKGYCWKQCGPKGSGQWCWTAENGGYGQWIGCSSADQCGENQACGIGGDDCKACGCSC